MEDLIMIAGVIFVVTIYWTFRGLLQLFSRHNTIIVIVYIVFLIPIAWLHMLFLGIFGLSKKEKLKKDVKAKAEFDLLVEKEKNNQQ